MSRGRWKDQALPGALRRVLDSADADQRAVAAQRDALQRRLAALGVLPSPAAAPPGPSSAPTVSSGSLSSTGAIGSLAVQGKAWVCALLIGTTSGAAAYAVTRALEPSPAPTFTSAGHADHAAPGRPEHDPASAPPVTQAPHAPGPQHGPVTPPVTAEVQRPAARRIARSQRSNPSLRDEVALIDRMRNSLGDSPGAALRDAETHARSFPRGALTLERELLRIEALLRDQRRSEAELAASKLISDFPASAYARRARRLLQRATEASTDPTDPSGF
jgi:hypothetical protein